MPSPLSPAAPTDAPVAARRRVLLLGWDYAPSLSGGLGTASSRLAHKLAERVELTVIVPRLSLPEAPAEEAPVAEAVSTESSAPDPALAEALVAKVPAAEPAAPTKVWPAGEPTPPALPADPASAPAGSGRFSGKEARVEVDTAGAAGLPVAPAAGESGPAVPLALTVHRLPRAPTAPIREAAPRRATSAALLPLVARAPFRLLVLGQFTGPQVRTATAPPAPPVYETFARVLGRVPLGVLPYAEAPEAAWPAAAEPAPAVFTPEVFTPAALAADALAPIASATTLVEPAPVAGLAEFSLPDNELVEAQAMGFALPADPARAPVVPPASAAAAAPALALPQHPAGAVEARLEPTTLTGKMAESPEIEPAPAPVEPPLLAAAPEPLAEEMVEAPPQPALADADPVAEALAPFRQTRPTPDPLTLPSTNTEVVQFSRLAARLASAEPVEVVYAHDWPTFLAGAEIRLEKRVPLVLHVHSTAWDRQGAPAGMVPAGWVFELERQAFRAADLLVAVSHYGAQTLTEQYAVPPERIRVVYHGLDDQGPAPHESWDARQAGPQPLVLFVGRLTSQKNPLGFVEIARQVLAEVPNARFALAGDGPQRVAVEASARALGISTERLRVLGFLSEAAVLRQLRAAAVVCLPARSEPFGLAALEAAGAGVPLVLSTTTGAVEVLPGALTAPWQAAADLAAHVVTLLTDEPARRRAVRENAAAVRRLTWERAASGVAAVLAEAMQRKRKIGVN